ncbi:vacuolar cation/proton exchanger 5-like isoform X2 [Daucus carota subsp. sativus]
MKNLYMRSAIHRIFQSIKIVLLSNKMTFLLAFGPLAILIHGLTSQQGWVFVFSLVGIIPMAERLGWATEQLAYNTGETAGGLLDAIGNATELIISIAAMKNGMLRVIHQSLLGSILSNMLLMLGFAFYSGGLVHPNKQQVFGKALMNVGVLFNTVMILQIPAVLHFSQSELHFGNSELVLSRFSSCVMLTAYVVYLFFQLTSQNSMYTPIKEEESNEESSDDENDDDEKVPLISKRESIIWLIVLTSWISILSDYLVNAIEGASVALNMPVAFISVILLPIVGNATEHAGAIRFAMEDKLDLSLEMAIGSSTQIAMFGIPFCVVFGWICGYPVDLNFQPFETATVFMTLIAVAFMLQEGNSNHYKGQMLLLCYLILAATFYVHRDPLSSVVPPVNNGVVEDNP